MLSLAPFTPQHRITPNVPVRPSSLCRSTLAGVLNIAGMLFASTLFVGFTNCMTVQHTVEVQR